MGLHWLGRLWDDVIIELQDEDIHFSYQISRSSGRIEGTGDLRVARVLQNQKKWDFTLIYDRYVKDSLAP